MVTKVILDLIFLLGLITAGMSIGRAAASNPGQEKTDFTWRNLPPCYFTMVEEKLGTTVACAPAIRQFVSYVRRTGTARPSKRRQPRNADFVKFRQRVKLRDIFWYRKPDLGGNDSQAQNLSRPEGVRSGDSPVTEEVKNSPLDWFHNKVKYAIDPRTRGRDVGKIDTSPTMSSKQDSERAMTRLSNERSTSGSHMGTDQQRPSASDVELGPVSESCRGHRPRENVGDEEIAINHEISVAQEAANNRANLLSTYPRTTDGTLGSGIQHHSRAHKLEPPPPAKRIG
ncbi:MAG: hypothetical protein M1831_002654 [Alyxoria varia]|nr:MAG: hypothetical protein M1831_002654 [Alyxoria varia]